MRGNQDGGRLPWTVLLAICSACWRRFPIRGGRKASSTSFPTYFCFRSWRSWPGQIPTARCTRSSISTWRGSKRTFALGWTRAPAYTTLRGILQGLDVAQVERVFRLHAEILSENAACPGLRLVAFDGKTLRGSFDNFSDQKAAHLVRAFATDSALVLGHLEIDDKSNEIPAVQRLLGELGLAESVITVDAMHCQKKPSKSPPTRAVTASPR